jgi:hypothetical protein
MVSVCESYHDAIQLLCNGCINPIILRCGAEHCLRTPVFSVAGVAASVDDAVGVHNFVVIN